MLPIVEFAELSLLLFLLVVLTPLNEAELKNIGELKSPKLKVERHDE